MLAALLLGEPVNPGPDALTITDSCTDTLGGEDVDIITWDDFATDGISWAVDSVTDSASVTDRVHSLQGIGTLPDAEYVSQSISQSRLFNDSDATRVSYVHASAYAHPYLLGFSRDVNPNNSPFSPTIVRLDVDDISTYQTFNVVDPTGYKLWHYSAACIVGQYVYTVAYGKDAGNNYVWWIVRISPATMSYTLCASMPGAFGQITQAGDFVCSDGTYLYVHDGNLVRKFDMSSWTQVGSCDLETAFEDYEISTLPRIHAGAYSSGHVFVGTQSVGADLYNGFSTVGLVAKIRTSDMTALDVQPWVSITDDADVTSSHFVGSPEMMLDAGDADTLPRDSGNPSLPLHETWGMNMGLAAYNQSTGARTYLGSFDADMDSRISAISAPFGRTVPATSSYGVFVGRNRLLDLKHGLKPHDTRTDLFVADTTWVRAYVVRLDQYLVDQWDAGPPNGFTRDNEWPLSLPPNPFRKKFVRRIAAITLPSGHGVPNESIVHENNVDVFCFTWGGTSGASGIIKMPGLIPAQEDEFLLDGFTVTDETWSLDGQFRQDAFTVTDEQTDLAAFVDDHVDSLVISDVAQSVGPAVVTGSGVVAVPGRKYSTATASVIGAASIAVAGFRSVTNSPVVMSGVGGYAVHGTKAAFGLSIVSAAGGVATQGVRDGTGVVVVGTASDPLSAHQIAALAGSASGQLVLIESDTGYVAWNVPVTADGRYTLTIPLDSTEAAFFPVVLDDEEIGSAGSPGTFSARLWLSSGVHTLRVGDRGA
jgi:hypothetical protein